MKIIGTIQIEVSFSKGVLQQGHIHCLRIVCGNRVRNSDRDVVAYKPQIFMLEPFAEVCGPLLSSIANYVKHTDTRTYMYVHTYVCLCVLHNLHHLPSNASSNPPNHCVSD